MIKYVVILTFITQYTFITQTDLKFFLHILYIPIAKLNCTFQLQNLIQFDALIQNSHQKNLPILHPSVLQVLLHLCIEMLSCVNFWHSLPMLS